VSNALLARFHLSSEALARWGILRGLLFIGISGGLIFLPLRRLQISNANLEATVSARTSALMKSEQHFRSLFDNMLHGFAYCKMIFDEQDRPVDFVYLEVNQAYGELTGLMDVVGRKASEVNPWITESRPELLESYGRVASTGKPEKFELDLTPLGKWFSVSAYSLEEGFFVTVFDNIIAHKQAEQALRASEERFRQLIEGAPEGIYVQTDDLIRYVNAAAVAMFGAETQDQILGRCYLHHIDPGQRAIVRERARILQNGRESVPLLEERFSRLDGTQFDVEVTATRTTFEGRDGGVVFFRDITERKRAEQEMRLLEQQLRQVQKMEAIGRLAGGVAHDFNNLLMVINTYAELLEARLPDDDKFRRNTQEILKAAKRAAQLTGQLLAFSRNQVLAPTVLDLNTVVAESAKMLKRLIGEDIEMVIHAEKSLWPIKADPDQIFQVLMNLCVNARDAMPRGGKLTVASENVTFRETSPDRPTFLAAGDYVGLSVADNGVGISQDVQEKLFEPFFTTKPVGSGTGLGLATVYGIVKQSGGYVLVDSKLGEGARFTIYLPRVEATVTEATNASAERVQGGTETVLVAEDEETLRGAVCEFLSRLGYRVLEADSGPQALSIAREQSIDLLITDVVMPRMSGRNLSQIMRGFRPQLRTIYMSGYMDDAILRHGISEQGTAFLQKPFGMATLARKVREVIGLTKD
jgi:PAS domain S-box-containing protein